ncbi:aminotransferase class III [Agromyces sp. Root81]|uniref:aspartate aminotransferase family protein n=1 Tax=Agromyces sp. Root81 TaxID=1736601 RepID=UPI0006FFE68E|nr:aminotransferase class III-fold pyridoxal phosphate-dependent enzyme [Agromyces sp. Root81]KRC60441.1 aminotransferase class III [Agromyces sp. Root81]
MVSDTSRYARSIEQLVRAEKTIPLGAQTYSKSRGTFPPGIAPIYGDRAEGCRIWDVDGHEYVDLVNALASVTLGYGDPEITAAVIEQLSRGVTISLTHPIEAVVAEKLVDMVPSAEMVRFGKNGSDATSAAVRVARGFTGRDHVITCGYHGWHDWTIASMDSRNLGVPGAVKELVHAVPFNDLDAVEQVLRATPTAAIVLEPMNVVFPKPGYLEGLRALADRYGAILVFDEMITGFRFAKGGAQEYFGVTPDLSTFGKGLANGYPVSAVAGRRDLMMLLERVFFSGTFSGELLSLTAANVVLDRIANTDAIETLYRNGETVRDRAQAAIDALEMNDVVSLSGHPTWTFLVWNPELGEQLDLLKVLFMQEMSRSGVLMIATHNVSAAHDDAAFDTIGAAYSHALGVVKLAIESGDPHGFLDAEVTTLAKSVR